LGLEVVEVAADGLAGLVRGRTRGTSARGGHPALAFAAVPPAWLSADEANEPLALNWMLLLARPDERELLDIWSALEVVARRAPTARIGACVFGVRTLADARHTFEGLATLAELELEHRLLSYGVLIDDIHLSRSIVSHRPIGLAHPGSAAARALADVAAMLIEDACDGSTS
jgi:hypothetical protein